MKEYLNKIVHGDSLDILKKLPNESIDCIVTSPPYWALRDYGTKGQLGMEPTVWLYLENLLRIFDEAKRVLKKNGTCWVNLGDTYAGSGKGSGDKNPDPKFKGGGRERTIKVKTPGFQNKTLMQIPSRFAIEMMNRGWLLRNEIIWHKPSCMPESVKDRFTVDFEKIFFFTKSPKYYFEQQHEPLSAATFKDKRLAQEDFTQSRRQRNYPGQAQQGGGMLRPGAKGRNKRTVWRVTTKPFKDAHFATFPQDLIETPIKAGCPGGGIVLDPFMGAGTTAIVAMSLGRNFIGIELKSDYIKMAEKRITQVSKK